MPAKKAGRKPKARAKVASSAKTDASAKPSGKVNKSALIRSYYEKKPQAKPAEIVAALKKKGINVSAQQVSTTRLNAIKSGRLTVPGGSTAKVQKPNARPGRPAKAKAVATQEGSISVDDLLQAKVMVEQLGGIEKSRQAISALEKLLG